VGIVWCGWYLWQAQQREARLRAIERQRRKADERHRRHLATLAKDADVKRMRIIQMQQQADADADLERAKVMEAASKGQRAFVEHWGRVMGKRKQ
jgi:hypothetical protein